MKSIKIHFSISKWYLSFHRFNKYLSQRVDIFSLSIFTLFAGFFIGGQHEKSYLFFFLFVIISVLFLLYKSKIFLFLFIFVLGLAFGVGIFHTYREDTKISGEFSYAGTNKIVETSRGLWFKEKLVIDDDFFVQNKNFVTCDVISKYEVIEDSDLNNQGVFRKVSCQKFWKYDNHTSSFSELNNYLATKYNVFSTDNAEFLKGITLGIKPSKDLNTAFQRTGLSHVLVISGFNITLILTIITTLLSKLKNVYKIILSLFLTAGFVFLVGPSAPVLRAAFMGLIGYFATFKFRNINYLRILLISSVVMLALDIYTIYSISFHLSFLATLGIILFGEKVAHYFRHIPQIIAEPFGQSIAAGVFAIPYTINIFSTFSPVMFLANILVLPFMSFLSIVAYIFLFLPIKPLQDLITAMSDFIVQDVLYLANFKSAQQIIDLSQKNIVNLIFFVLLLLIAILFIFSKYKIFSRIEKHMKIE